MTTHPNAGHRQRLRERFLTEDAAAFTDEMLLELLLTYALPQQDVRPLAEELLRTFGSLAAVLSAQSEELCRVKGVKTATAVLLQVVHRLQQQQKRQDADVRAAPAAKPAANEDVRGTLSADADVCGTPARRRNGLFSKAMLNEAIALLPTLPDTDSLPDIKSFLSARLRFNAEQTRNRYAHYIISHIFPGGVADAALRHFARALAGARDVAEVCFYRFITAEPLMQDVIDALLLPRIGSGQMPRLALKTYLRERFPDRSTQECSVAMVDALRAAGIAKADKTTVSFSYRAISLPAFAFVVHSAFPEPGMYDIAALERHRAIRAMLWNPDRLLPALYELRNQGLISKVSEIDAVRQFTTKWTLDELVEHLVQKNA